MIGMFFINGLSWFSDQLDARSLKCSNPGKLLLHLAKSSAARGRRNLFKSTILISYAVLRLSSHGQSYQFVQDRPGQTNPVLHGFFH